VYWLVASSFKKSHILGLSLLLREKGLPGRRTSLSLLCVCTYTSVKFRKRGTGAHLPATLRDFLSTKFILPLCSLGPFWLWIWLVGEKQKFPYSRPQQRQMSVCVCVEGKRRKKEEEEEDFSCVRHVWVNGPASLLRLLFFVGKEEEKKSVADGPQRVAKSSRVV
jgi:hypothetical protein